MPSRILCAIAIFALLPATAQAFEPDAQGPLSSLEQFNLAALVGKSPWLTMACRGAYQYFTTPEDQQNRLGFTADPRVFGTLGVLLLLVAVKDSVLTFLGRFKIPLDVLGELFHMAGGAVAFAYLGEVAFQGQPSVTGTHGIADAGSAEQTSWLWAIVSWLMMCAVHSAVWIVFNTIEVAVILCPFPFVDTILKSIRTILIGVITGAAAIHPALGFLVSLPVFLVCLFVLPFALRVGRVGWVFCFDTLGRWFADKGPTGRVMAFASWGLTGSSLLRFGEVTSSADGKRAFVFRRFGFLWHKTVPLPEDVYVGIGTFAPVLLVDVAGSSRRLLLFPPRYVGQEQKLAAQLGIGRVENVSLTAGVSGVTRAIWSRLFGTNRQAADAM